jgi:hypothetical protein
LEGKPNFIMACLDGSIKAAGLKQIRKRREEPDANGTGISGGNQDVVDLVGETRNP